MPQGPTEEHLVEELAGILWRKHRLRLAEAAAYRHGLNDALAPHRRTASAALAHLDAAEPTEDVATAIRATADDTDHDQRDMLEAQATTRRALALLGSRLNDPYEAALGALHEETRAWWARVLARDPDALGEGEEPAIADAEGLWRFLENEALPWFETRQTALANRPLIPRAGFRRGAGPGQAGAASGATRCTRTASWSGCW